MAVNRKGLGFLFLGGRFGEFSGLVKLGTRALGVFYGCFGSLTKELMLKVTRQREPGEARTPSRC